VHVCYNSDKALQAVLHIIMNIHSLLLKRIERELLSSKLNSPSASIHISTELTHLFEDSLNILITAVIVQ